jgi:hypothetical protein
MKGLYLTLILSGLTAISMAQTTPVNVNGTKLNAITTAVPFLTIAPDARSAGMGDAAAAVSPDGNAAYWNPSKLAFIDVPTQLSLSYSPWMRRVFPDVNMAYLSFIKRLDENNTVATSLRYFNLGTVDSYDENLTSLGTLHPNEFSFDVSLARKFGENFSMGLTARYIHSDISQGASVGGIQTQAGNSFAADVSMYSRTPVQELGNPGTFAFGIDISNIGPKMNYNSANNAQLYFLPTNLRLGIANTMVIDELDEVTFAFDVNKLLVPTPPIRDGNGNIILGKDDNVPMVTGILGSFSDAPYGAKEELQEINYSTGFEYWYKKQFALRAGYFYENPNKGNRQYVTLGLGFRNEDITVDFSFLTANPTTSPLANVVQFSVGYSFGAGVPHRP